MITRRALAFVRKRDWAGMGFELVVVALGVMLGIEASNWNERRHRADRQQEVMNQLAAELDESVREADQRVASARQLIANLAIVRAAADSGRLDPRQSKQFDEGICRSFLWWQPAWRLSTVDQLIASGDLDLIRSPDLRSGLVAYRDSVSAIRDDIMALGSTITNRGAVLDRYVDYAPSAALADVRTEAEIVDLPLGRCATNLTALHADPEARNAIKSIESNQAGIFLNQLVIAEEARRLRAMLKETR